MEKRILDVKGPHQGQPVFISGEPLASAKAAMVMVHGRGASAEDMLGLAEKFKQPGLAFLVPQARDSVWYPQPYSVPTAQNEPWLSSALDVVGAAVTLAGIGGVPVSQTILLGFSQGACLVLEYAARNGRRYGGLAGLSGGLIGPEEEERTVRGNLSGTPVFLGCSDPDPYIPVEHVHYTARVLKDLGGQVTERLYPALGHQVNEDEIQCIRGWVRQLLGVTTS
jgi:phospholipase/carboxylesterase